jgi:hypothetical protein
MRRQRWLDRLARRQEIGESTRTETEVPTWQQTSWDPDPSMSS